MIQLDVPNLDDATTDPQELVMLARNLDLLSAYALEKAAAMKSRLDGKITAAKRYEARCEMLYNLLPPSWRW